jgi:hypothetical protein
MSVPQSVGVILPVYPLVTGPLLHALEHASSVTQFASNEEGEVYMLLAEVVVAAAVPKESIVVVPLTTPGDEEAMDFSYLARSQVMFVQLHERPQQFMTYGHCLGYSAGTLDLPLAIEEILKFPSASTYVLAKARLMATIRAAAGPEVDLQLGGEASKRQCVRQPGMAGERSEDTGEKMKGTSSIVFMDLENVRRYTRTKKDLALREKELNFCYRAMDVEKQEFGITSDCTIQLEPYRSMLCEQGDTQTEERHKAIAACGLISRVHRLPLFRSN